MFTVPLFQGSFLEIGRNRPCLRLDKAPKKDVVVFFSRRYGFAPYTANYQKLSKKKKPWAPRVCSQTKIDQLILLCFETGLMVCQS